MRCSFVLNPNTRSFPSPARPPLVLKHVSGSIFWPHLDVSWSWYAPSGQVIRPIAASFRELDQCSNPERKMSIYTHSSTLTDSPIVVTVCSSPRTATDYLRTSRLVFHLSLLSPCHKRGNCSALQPALRVYHSSLLMRGYRWLHRKHPSSVLSCPSPFSHDTLLCLRDRFCPPHGLRASLDVVRVLVALISANRPAHHDTRLGCGRGINSLSFWLNGAPRLRLARPGAQLHSNTPPCLDVWCSVVEPSAYRTASFRSS